MLRRRARRQRRHRAGKVRLLRSPQLSGPAPSVVLGMTLSGTPMSDPATDVARSDATIDDRPIAAPSRLPHRELIRYLERGQAKHGDATEPATDTVDRQR